MKKLKEAAENWENCLVQSECFVAVGRLTEVVGSKGKRCTMYFVITCDKCKLQCE